MELLWKSYRRVWFGCECLKKKHEIIQDYKNNLNPMSKRPKLETNYKQVNELVVKWILDTNSRRISVSGPLVQQTVLKFSKELGQVVQSIVS